MPTAKCAGLHGLIRRNRGKVSILENSLDSKESLFFPSAGRILEKLPTRAIGTFTSLQGVEKIVVLAKVIEKWVRHEMEALTLMYSDNCISCATTPATSCSRRAASGLK